jgi:hypothetical protein
VLVEAGFSGLSLVAGVSTGLLLETDSTGLSTGISGLTGVGLPVSVTGQIVVDTAVVTVVRIVEPAGQSGTSSPQSMMVETWVSNMVEVVMEIGVAEVMVLFCGKGAGGVEASGRGVDTSGVGDGDSISGVGEGD